MSFTVTRFLSQSSTVPRLSVSGSVLCSSLPEAACSHKTVFKGKRSSPCLRSPSAMSVPLVRDFCLPGAIWSQAEGGMSPTSKSQTGQRGQKHPCARARHGTARRGTHGTARRACTRYLKIQYVATYWEQ